MTDSATEVDATTEEEPKAPAKVFTQEDVDRIIADRLARERKVRAQEELDKSGDLSERLSAAEKRAQEAELKALRLTVAAEKGLTPSQAKRLVGETQEELNADAEELLATFAPPKVEDDGRSVPRELLKPGASPGDEDVVDADKIAESILSRKF